MILLQCIMHDASCECQASYNAAELQLFCFSKFGLTAVTNCQRQIKCELKAIQQQQYRGQQRSTATCGQCIKRVAQRDDTCSQVLYIVSKQTRLPHAGGTYPANAHWNRVYGV